LRTGETETAQEPPPICAHAEAFLDMLRSQEAAEAIGPAMQCCYHYDARPRDPFYDEERELAEVRRKNLRFREVTGPVCAVCGLATVCSLLYGPSSVVRYRIYHICNTFQRGRSYHHRV
jgi:hypothetical protein